MTLFEAYNYHIYLCNELTETITNKDTQVTVCNFVHGSNYKTTLTINGKQHHFSTEVVIND